MLLRLRRPAVSVTGREKTMAPAFLSAPSMMDFMIWFFSLVRATMSTSSFSFTRSMPMNLAAPSMPVPLAWMTVPPPAPAARAASMMEPV